MYPHSSYSSARMLTKIFSRIHMKHMGWAYFMHIMYMITYKVSFDGSPVKLCLDKAVLFVLTSDGNDILYSNYRYSIFFHYNDSCNRFGVSIYGSEMSNPLQLCFYFE